MENLIERKVATLAYQVVKVGEQLIAPIILNEANSVRALTIDVYYDAHVLRPLEDLIQIGQQIPIGEASPESPDLWSFVKNLVRPGRIRIVLYTAQSDLSGPQEMAQLGFLAKRSTFEHETPLDIRVGNTARTGSARAGIEGDVLFKTVVGAVRVFEESTDEDRSRPRPMPEDPNP